MEIEGGLMFSKSDTLKLKVALKDVLTTNYSTFGICNLLWCRQSVAYDVIYELAINGHLDKFEFYSFEPSLPVRGVHIPADEAYLTSANKWSGEYGRRRRLLVKYLINLCDQWLSEWPEDANQ